MHFELKISETKSFIYNIEFHSIVYFLLGLVMGVCILAIYNYSKHSKGGNI